MASVRLMAKVLCVGALGVLTACGFARVPYDSGQQSTQSAAACSRSTGNASQVRVCAGDTLTSISRANNVTIGELMRQNNLPDDRIRVGQLLTIPGGSTGGQTVQRSSTELLPESEPVTNRAPSGPVIIGSGAPPVTQPTVEPNVQPTTQPAAQPTVTREAEEQQPVVVAEEQAPPAEVTVQAPDDGPVPVPRSRPAQAPAAPATETAQPAAAPAATAKAPEKPAAKAATTFLVPVQGSIVSEFGPKSGGLHNDGINIAAPRGTPFLATADGEIAYAGDGLPGFGNLILIRHADDWTSAYAHADSMSVKRGDQVKRGDTIGTVGSTGSVSTPQLHFELRKHDRAVDPKPLLGP